MTQLRFILAAMLSAILVLNACMRDDDDGGNPMPPDPPMTECDTGIAPIIFIHGALGSGDTWAIQVQRFLANDLCDDHYYAFDWNSIDQNNAPDLEALDLLVNDILASTGATQVNLAGHSAGGRLSYEYMSDATRASKVAHYAHIGSFRVDSLPGPANSKVPTVNIWSPDDQVIDDKGDIPNATNVSLAGKDHYQIATDEATFSAMYELFGDGRTPTTTNPEQQAEISISGRALQLGENKPEQGATVEIYTLDGVTGRRLVTSPETTFTIDESGNWGPVSLMPGVYYEFYLAPADTSARSVHYYKEPFQTSNPLVYLRTLPGQGSTAGALLAALPEDDGQSVVAIFSSSQAVIEGRDELTAGMLNLATSEFAAQELTSIAFFLYDDGDMMTSGDPHFIFSLAPFLTGADVFIPTDTVASTTTVFNGRTLNIPNWKSDSEGVSVAIFD